MRRTTANIGFAVVISSVLMISLFSAAGSFFLGHAAAAELGSRSLELSDSRAAQSGVTYNVAFHITTVQTLGSIQIMFCSNSTFPTDPCTAPGGFDASSAVFTQESGVSGFSISPNSTANDIIITRPPSPTAAVTAGLVFNNITNPSNAGSYYVRVLTYPTSDATGAYTDSGGMAFPMNVAVNVHVDVPPYLLFCTGNTISGTDCSTASGDFIDLGELSTTHTSTGQSQMVIATNAQNGYSITATGTTLTSGNNTIPALSVDSPSQVGVSQFGINLRANTNPLVGANPTGAGSGAPTTAYNQPNLYQYKNGDTIATNPAVEEDRKFTVSYLVNISKAQPAGIYASTFTYVALGNF